MSDVRIPAGLAAAFEVAPGATYEQRHGDPVAFVALDEYVGFMTAVRDAGYEMFVDLCGVDHLTRNPRFDVVVNVVNVPASQRLRVLVGIDGADPVCPTLTDVYPGANFYERETWDLLGIGFDGHPDLTRILLPDEWEGHPLRKNSPVGSIPVQFKEANKAT